MSTPERRRPPTVVFDLGGVLIDWDPRYLYRKLMAEDEVDAVPRRGRLLRVEPRAGRRRPLGATRSRRSRPGTRTAAS